MPQKSDRIVLLKQFGTITKQLILDGEEVSEDFKEIVELNNVLFRMMNLKKREPIRRLRPPSTLCGFYQIISST